MTEQELLEELEKSIESNNRNNLDLIKVLNGTDTQDITLQDGSVVPSLSKRVQAEVVEDSNYLFKSDNLASVEDKQSARTNLGVPSVTEMNTAITNATPNATETVAGKAKIATTSITQAGVNDTDFITPLKLNKTVFGISGSCTALTIISNTTYTNQSDKLEIILLLVPNSNITGVLTLNNMLLSNIGVVGSTAGGTMITIPLLPNWTFKFNMGTQTLSAIKVA